MGGIAGGLAGVGSGLDQGLQQYGQQIRSVLENRRSQFAALLAQQAQQENDPQRRGELLSHAGDLYAGKDMAKVAPAIVKTLQGHRESDAALGQAAGGPPAQPTPSPGPQAGKAPGTGAAAQPATSPVQPQSQSPQGSQAVSQPSTIGVGGVVPPVEAQPQAAPQAQPSAAVPPVSQPSNQDRAFEAIRGKRQEILQKYQTQLMQATPHMQPIIEAQMKAEIEGLAPWEQQQMRAANLSDLEARPEYQSANPFQKLQIQEQAAGYQPSGMMGMASLMRVHQMEVDATHMSPEQKSTYGIPANSSGKFTADVDGMGNPMGQARQGWAGTVGTLNAAGQTGIEDKNTALGAGGGLTAVGGGPSVNPSLVSSQIHPHLLTGPHGEQFFTSPAQAGAGPIAGAINPSFVPSNTTSPRSISTTDAEGNPVTQLVNTTSTKTRGGGGMSGGPSGGGSSPTSFPKPFTPQQQMHGEQQLGQYNLAIDRIQKIQSQLPLLNSMIESGKLNVQMDSSGLVRAIVNRMMPLTPGEAEFVGNFRTMMEDINLLRGPMGATGFRGPEAWAALQAQRGQLLARPEITKQVLTNTLTALKAQQGPLSKRFGGNKEQPGAVSPVGGEPQPAGTGGMTITLPSGKKVTIQ